MELSAADTIDRKDLLLAKKKMLAELELNDGKGVEINGREVSKNDIIRFFDDLQQSSDLSYHLAVYHDKVLLRFLEYNILEKKDKFAANPLYAEEAFISWLSPYYAHSFTAFADECFHSLLDDEWTTLLSNPLLMNSYYQETAWENLEKGIHADTERLKIYSDKKITQAELNGIAPICDFRHIMMLERLPAERFASARDELAFAIMQVCISAFNHANRGWARNTIENAHILAVSEELKKQVYDKKYEMDTIASGNNGGSSEKTPLWTIVRIALFVLFIAARLGGSCNRSSSSYNNYNYNYTPPATERSVNTDSSFRTLQERMKKLRESKNPLSDSEAGESLQELLKRPAPANQ